MVPCPFVIEASLQPDTNVDLPPMPGAATYCALRAGVSFRISYLDAKKSYLSVCCLAGLVFFLDRANGSGFDLAETAGTMRICTTRMVSSPTR